MRSRKGGDFERTVCHFLSQWVSGGKENDCFWRSAMSGGRATVGRRKGSGWDNCAGDITCTSVSGQLLTRYFVVECKFWRDLKIQNFLFDYEPNSKKGIDWVTWLDKLLHECGKARQPLLIAKQNHQEPICFTSPQGLALLSQLGPLRTTGTVFHNRITPFEVFCMDSLKRLDFRKAKQWGKHHVP